MTTILLALAIAGALFLLLVVCGALAISGRLADDEREHDQPPEA